jgi:dephospho-CoA kinase
MIVGVTGGIGSGKSLVAETICSFENTIYFHADKEAKLLMNNSSVIKDKIIAAFGQKSYDNGVLNNKYISSLVFKNPNQLKILNTIVHPQVKEHFKKFVERQSKNTLIIYENAIIFETNSSSICDIIISVNSPRNIRIKRVMKRDNSTKIMVENIMNNQWSDAKRNLLSNYIINNIEKEETLLKIKKIYNFLTKKLPFT